MFLKINSYLFVNIIDITDIAIGEDKENNIRIFFTQRGGEALASAPFNMHNEARDWLQEKLGENILNPADNDFKPDLNLVKGQGN